MSVMTQLNIHIPCLSREVIRSLQVKPGRKYIDCTLGGGGHAAFILEESSPEGKLLGLDVDPIAIDIAKEKLKPFGKSATVVRANFSNLLLIAPIYSFYPVDGILFDLGLSSIQLEASGRGFSFLKDEPLDMRFDPEQELTAAVIVNTYPEAELTCILRRYGEEKHSRQIARRIVESRPITSTRQLVEVIKRAVPRQGRLHPATRTFQALRIAVNKELENLASALPQAVSLLRPRGRLAVISYHSLEDRVVKGFFYRESKDCLCPTGTPICICGHTATLKLIERKPITPSPAEVKANPRSRSAKLRVAERI